MQTFNISLPVDLVKKADFVAKNEYQNRSELIKEDLRTYLLSKQTWGRTIYLWQDNWTKNVY